MKTQGISLPVHYPKSAAPLGFPSQTPTQGEAEPEKNTLMGTFHLRALSSLNKMFLGRHFRFLRNRLG